MKLELKHLAPYLNYNVKYENTKNSNIYPLRSLSSGINMVDFGWGDAMELDEVRLILRPMSDVESYFEDLYGKLEHQDVTDYFDADFLWANDSLEINEIEFATPETLPFGTIQVLFKHHFDVFGLIDKGLAIAYEEQERGQKEKKECKN